MLIFFWAGFVIIIDIDSLQIDIFGIVQFRQQLQDFFLFEVRNVQTKTKLLKSI